MAKRLFFHFFVVLSFALPVVAEIIEVSHVNSYEVKRLEVQSGETVDVVVHMKSAGEPLDGMRVMMISNSDGRMMASLVTDPMGVVRFQRVPPGQYSVSWERVRAVEDDEGRIGIGDVVLERRK